MDRLLDEERVATSTRERLFERRTPLARNGRYARSKWEGLDVGATLGSHVRDTRRCAEALPVNKGEFVEAIASAANLSKTDAASALNAFIGSCSPQLRTATRSRFRDSARLRRPPGRRALG